MGPTRGASAREGEREVARRPVGTGGMRLVWGILGAQDAPNVWRDEAMRIRLLARILALCAVPALVACAEIETAYQDVRQGIDQGIDSVFGDEGEEAAAAAPAPEAEELYRQGLAARDRDEEAEAFGHFMAAAEQGHGPAAYETGMAYKDGRGTPRDLEAGADWINKAAERGEARAQFLVGAAYYGGTGVEKDEKAAIAYLSKAAQQGHAQAQYLLGEAYSDGRGVAKNATWAARWFGKAAAQGLGQAQFAYGVVHASGLGLPANKEAGYAWLVLAEKSGHEEAPIVRKALAKGMTADEIKRADARAAAFRPTNGGGFADRPTVMYVQQVLNDLGFQAGPVDGMVGPRTREAVGRYQEKNGLSKDGRISPTLLDRLFEAQGHSA